MLIWPKGMHATFQDSLYETEVKYFSTINVKIHGFMFLEICLIKLFLNKSFLNFFCLSSILNTKYLSNQLFAFFEK